MTVLLPGQKSFDPAIAVYRARSTAVSHQTIRYSLFHPLRKKNGVSVIDRFGIVVDSGRSSVIMPQQRTRWRSGRDICGNAEKIRHPA